MDNGSEFVIGVPSSYSNIIRYIHLRANNIRKSCESISPPLTYGLFSMIYQ